MVSLPQHGGEGTENYKGHKSNSDLKQHGGEGSDIGKKGLDNDFSPDVKASAEYTGPGRFLKTTSD